MECEDLRIVLLGKTGSGKSATGNTILGRNVFTVGKSMDSFTKSCQENMACVEKRNISVTDTPGHCDTKMSEEELKPLIEKCVYMSAPGPHVFLLVIRLDVKYTEEEKNAVKWIQKNFGEDAVKYTIILFTHADVLEGETLKTYVEKSESLKALVPPYNERYHAFNNDNREHKNQVVELLAMIDKVVRDNGGEHYTNEMYKKAQGEITWERRKQVIIDYGKTAITVGGFAAVGGGASALAQGARVVARAGGAAIAGAAGAIGGKIASTLHR